MSEKRMKQKKSVKVCHSTFPLQRSFSIIIVVLMITALLLSACGSQKDNKKSPQDADADTQTQGQNTENSNPSGETGTSPVGQYDKDTDPDSTANDNKEKTAGSSREGTSSDHAADKSLLKKPFRVGDTLQDGDLKIIYLASGHYEEESEYQQPAPGCQYIYARFAFQNTGAKYDCPISLFSFNCYADGFAAQAYYGGEKDLAASLSAGRSTIGNLYFSVPEDAKEIEIEYRPDNLNVDKIHFAYEGEKEAAIELPPDTRRTDSAFGVGSTAASSRQKIHYLSCQKDDSDNEFIRPADGCTFYTLSFEFENLLKEDRQISIHDFSCYADGASCAKSLFRDDYLSESVAGGRKAKGTVTFEVPDAAQTVEVEYDTGNSSDPHVVFTLR